MVERNFKENPVTTKELNECIWYAVVDDLIGGYSITTVNKPTSQLDFQNGEFEIGGFMDRGNAEHIVKLHNNAWNAFVDDSYGDNLMFTWEREMDEFYTQQLLDKSDPTR